jgi:hypothetical protein
MADGATAFGPRAFRHLLSADMAGSIRDETTTEMPVTRLAATVFKLGVMVMLWAAARPS